MIYHPSCAQLGIIISYSQTDSDVQNGSIQENRRKVEIPLASIWARMVIDRSYSRHPDIRGAVETLQNSNWTSWVALM